MNQNASFGGNLRDTTKKRKQAQLAGEKRYFTGLVCRNGHTAERHTSNGKCIECFYESTKRCKDRYNKSEQGIINNRAWRRSEKGKLLVKRSRERNPKQKWVREALSSAKKRVKGTEIPFTLTFEYLLGITPDTCPIFGTAYKFIGNGKMCDESASLDRINPDKGYVENNVAVISLKANRMKNIYGSGDIFKVAEWLREKGL